MDDPVDGIKVHPLEFGLDVGDGDEGECRGGGNGRRHFYGMLGLRVRIARLESGKRTGIDLRDTILNSIRN